MMGTSSNGGRSPASNGVDVKVPAKPKGRRFSIAEKARIVRELDACETGTVGAFLRREGIFSSQLYAWRRERDRGDLDAEAVTNRASKRTAAHALERRNRELEVENRKLNCKIAIRTYRGHPKKQRSS